MPIKEVQSPISSRSRVGKPASNQPLSPGARSNPGRGDQGASPEPPAEHVRPANRGEEPAEVVTVGPEG
jgi:hypothetical protein